MKLHKFNFKNEAVWMLIVRVFPLIVAFFLALYFIYVSRV